MKIAVIGNGVIGYCTAIALLQQGREVIIYTKDKIQSNPENTVSIVACALWQPYKLFNNLENESKEVIEQIWQISKKSLEFFFDISEKRKNQDLGVYKKKHFEYSLDSIKSNGNLKSDFYYIKLLKDFWASKNIKNTTIEEKYLDNSTSSNIEFRYLHGYLTYAIDPPIFLKFLEQLFISLGGELKTKKIGPSNLKSLKEKVVFNCTGLNGFSIFNKKKINIFSNRIIRPKKGVLLLYKLKNLHTYENTIVMGELTILCRKNELTIGTGEIKKGENERDLIDRLLNRLKELISNPELDDFGLQLFLKNHKININMPNKILIGSRPYFEDGKGYFLNHYNHQFGSGEKISLYNNFGHGGSGVTLCWGTAVEIANIYTNNVINSLNSFNPYRKKLHVNKYSVEFAHFDYKEIRKMSDYELNKKIEFEYGIIMNEFKRLKINRDDYSLCVLIDNKEEKNDESSELRLLNCLEKIDIDYIAYEDKLIEYLDDLEKFFPKNIKNEFDRYQINHQKLGCSQDIFLWYSIRFGLINYYVNDRIIVPISKEAISEKRSFYGNSIITLLPTSLKKFEDLADNYIKNTFGFEIVSSIKRIYYERTY
ncbi:FAD-dependent oxidoreductase [uncultured Winogradskyella sp.]|uniref:FAD-dependent oxidoreductase n=1 Tax=uncultured Winogradskyella sp. TaxID=395353 RepID=UPI00261593E6|nr:FAD-dependent oxidoreductase [uncultured Winogradskyella sp.]